MYINHLKNKVYIYIRMTVPKYIIVDYPVLENRLKEMINNLTNLKKNENGELYFYGSRTEQLECEHNKEIILSYIPLMKKIIKGHSNWSNMKNSEKLVANHLKFYCRVLTGEPIRTKCIRFPEFKSKMINVFMLPSNIKV